MANHQFQLESGRRIGVSAFGEPLAKRLVIFCLPTLCAGPFDPDPQATVASGLKVIQIDRPGYGGSDPLPPGTVPTLEVFADDIAEYLRHTETVATDVSALSFGTVAAVGWSFGGCVALALAARHPELVDSVAIVATPRPERLHAGERYSAIAELRKHGVERTATSLKASLDEDGHPSLVNLGIDEADPALLSLGVRGRVERALESGWVQRSEGAASDRMTVRDKHWMDAASDVSQRTLLVYGHADVVAGADDADWYGKRLPVSERIENDAAGHLVIIDEWQRILQFAAAD